MANKPNWRVTIAVAGLASIWSCSVVASSPGSPDSATASADADADLSGQPSAALDVDSRDEATVADIAAQDAATLPEQTAADLGAETAIAAVADAQQEASAVAVADAIVDAAVDAVTVDCGPPPPCQIWTSTDTAGACTPGPDPSKPGCCDLNVVFPVCPLQGPKYSCMSYLCSQGEGESYPTCKEFCLIACCVLDIDCASSKPCVVAKCLQDKCGSCEFVKIPNCKE